MTKPISIPWVRDLYEKLVPRKYHQLSYIENEFDGNVVTESIPPFIEITEKRGKKERVVFLFITWEKTVCCDIKRYPELVNLVPPEFKIIEIVDPKKPTAKEKRRNRAWSDALWQSMNQW